MQHHAINAITLRVWKLIVNAQRLQNAADGFVIASCFVRAAGANCGRSVLFPIPLWQRGRVKGHVA